MIIGSDLFTNHRRWVAFSYLFLKANRTKDKTVLVGNKTVALEIGEVPFYHGLTDFFSDTGMSRLEFVNQFNWMRDNDVVKSRLIGSCTIIKIVNIEAYQMFNDTLPNPRKNKPRVKKGFAREVYENYVLLLIGDRPGYIPLTIKRITVLLKNGETPTSLKEFTRHYKEYVNARQIDRKFMLSPHAFFGGKYKEFVDKQVTMSALEQLIADMRMERAQSNG